MRILVSGLRGLLGRSLAFQIFSSSLYKSHSFFSFQRAITPIDNSSISDLIVSSVYSGDCSSVHDWVKCISHCSPDIIVHIVQIRYLPQILEALSILNTAPKLIIVGTTAVFSSFTSCSDDYKRSEHLLQESNLTTALLRPTMIYGSIYDKNIHKLVSAICNNKPIFLPNGGSSLFQPIFFKDVSKSIYILLNRFISDNVLGHSRYNIPGPTILSLSSMIDVISCMTYRNPLKISVPIAPTLYITKMLQKYLGDYLPVSSEQILRLQEDKVFHSDWHRLDPSCQPTSFVDGISHLLDEMLGTSTRDY
jgi:hypothetical protein